MIRPNPNIGQVLAFTPFLIHGCAINWNDNITRFSLELRLFDKSKSYATSSANPIPECPKLLPQ